MVRQKKLHLRRGLKDQSGSEHIYLTVCGRRLDTINYEVDHKTFLHLAKTNPESCCGICMRNAEKDAYETEYLLNLSGGTWNDSITGDGNCERCGKFSFLANDMSTPEEWLCHDCMDASHGL